MTGRMQSVTVDVEKSRGSILSALPSAHGHCGTDGTQSGVPTPFTTIPSYARRACLPAIKCGHWFAAGCRAWCSILHRQPQYCFGSLFPVCSLGAGELAMKPASVCPVCLQTLQLATIEPHPTRSGIDILTYRCEQCDRARSTITAHQSLKERGDGGAQAGRRRRTLDGAAQSESSASTAYQTVATARQWCRPRYRVGRAAACLRRCNARGCAVRAIADMSQELSRIRTMSVRASRHT